MPQDHLRSWLGDRLGRDQIMTFADQNPNLYWCGRNGSLDAVRGPDDRPVRNAVSEKHLNPVEQG